jgi:2-polyprenyl-3-methyl-5-hydroxy-6-metoxy-1,4-benzoquinol methylase
MHRRDCPVCGADSRAPLEMVEFDEQHRYYAPANPARQRALTSAAEASAASYAMWRCGQCELEWANPMRAPNGEWYALAYSNLDLYPGARWEFDEVLGTCAPDEVVFDIGCGGGAFLKRCSERGIRGKGADFAADPVQQCVAQGLDVRQVNLDGEPRDRAEGDATVVTAFQVLEHLSDPARLFEFAGAVCAPHAALWVAIPSHRRPSRLFNKRDFLDQPPHHLTRWSDKSLAAIGQRCGWTLEEIRFEPLPLPAALWWISTHTGLYRQWFSGYAAQAGATERVVRWLQYPAALALRNTRYKAMTGFSMMGRFRRTSAQCMKASA